jgi:hypothetical protein
VEVDVGDLEGGRVRLGQAGGMDIGVKSFFLELDAYM